MIQLTALLDALLAVVPTALATRLYNRAEYHTSSCEEPPQRVLFRQTDRKRFDIQTAGRGKVALFLAPCCGRQASDQSVGHQPGTSRSSTIGRKDPTTGIEERGRSSRVRTDAREVNVMRENLNTGRFQLRQRCFRHWPHMTTAQEPN
ncbi:hypothetical protein DFH09DRAFT_1074775 [Mycena vulgaris]|nr:hypothetical protein DFH09DRAFT_1074775 [Mycena vulgaris]